MLRVFILSCHPLFGQGVESLLRQERGLEIVGRETDLDTAVARVRALNPDVVVLDSSTPTCVPTPAVIRLFEACRGVRVVGLNLHNNTMCIYRGEERLITDVKDLVEAIRPPDLARGDDI
ncbi:MAG: hypothetical protein ACUVXG_13850 [Anaerolineae bacterium]